MRRILSLLVAVGLWGVCAGRAAADVVDSGTYWVDIDDTVVPSSITGQVTFTGSSILAAQNPVAIAGTLLTFTAGPPGTGFGAFASTQTSAGGAAQLTWTIDQGTYVCTNGCNSGAPVSFVGTISNVSGALSGLLPANATYTSDGAGGFVTNIPGVPECSPPASGHRCFQGTAGFNAFQEIPTPLTYPPGPATVSASTSYYNALEGIVVPITTDVTFEGGITSDGATTTFSTVSNVAGAISSDFATAVGDWTAQYTDIVVSPANAYAGPVVVCSTFPAGPNHAIDSTGISICDFRILHEENGTFTDRTLTGDDCPLTPANPCPGTPRCIDPDLNKICGEVSSLSFFTVAPFVGDSDGDGIPDTVDACTRVTTGQLVRTPKLTAKHLDLPFGQQAVVWKGSFYPQGPPDTNLALGSSKGAHLRIDDAECGGQTPSTGTPFDVSLPPGLQGNISLCNPAKDGWQEKIVAPGNATYEYRNESGFLDAACSVPAQGITKLLVKDRRQVGAARVEFVLTAKGVGYHPIEDLAAPCSLNASLTLAAEPSPGVASPEALEGECGEFIWTAPVSTSKPAPFCTEKPVGSPKVEVCVGP